MAVGLPRDRPCSLDPAAFLTSPASPLEARGLLLFWPPGSHKLLPQDIHTGRHLWMETWSQQQPLGLFHLPMLVSYAPENCRLTQPPFITTQTCALLIKMWRKQFQRYLKIKSCLSRKAQLALETFTYTQRNTENSNKHKSTEKTLFQQGRPGQAEFEVQPSPAHSSGRSAVST